MPSSQRFMGALRGSPEHVERGLGRLPLERGGIAGEDEAPRDGAAVQGESTKTVPTGFVGEPPSGPVTPEIASPQAAPASPATPGHRLGRTGAHRAVDSQDGLGTPNISSFACSKRRARHARSSPTIPARWSGDGPAARRCTTRPPRPSACARCSIRRRPARASPGAPVAVVAQGLADGRLDLRERPAASACVEARARSPHPYLAVRRNRRRRSPRPRGPANRRAALRPRQRSGPTVRS